MPRGHLGYAVFLCFLAGYIVIAQQMANADNYRQLFFFQKANGVGIPH